MHQQKPGSYEELEAITEMTDESLILDIDIIEERHERELNEVTQQLEEQQKQFAEREKTLQDTLSSRDRTLEEQRRELTDLKQQLSEMTDLKQQLSEMKAQLARFLPQTQPSKMQEVK